MRERESEEEAEKEQEGEGESGGYIFLFCFVQFQPRIHNEEYISAQNEEAFEPDSCVCVQYLSERRFAVLCCHSTVMRVDSNS